MYAMESGCLPPSSAESPCPRLPPSHRVLSGFGEPLFPPRGSTLALPKQSLSPRGCCPPTGAHHHGQAPSALQGHPNIYHLKLWRYFNDFGCCGGRGTASSPGRRQPRNKDRCPPMWGIQGCHPPAGMLPSPGWWEDVQSSVLFVVGSVSFNQPGFPLSSVSHPSPQP